MHSGQFFDRRAKAALPFMEYCKANIVEKAIPLPVQAKQEIVNKLRSSYFKSVVQAWTVLDLYDYKHLWVEGFDTYFGYDNTSISSDTLMEIIHPEDLAAFSQLYYLVLEGLMNMKTPVKNIGHFCISYRIKNSSGDYVKVLETSNIIESDPKSNIPLINLSQISIIEGMQKSNQVTYYFLIRDEFDSVKIMQSFLNQFDNKSNIFNQTEIKIARLLKTGLTSKEIGDRVFLSKHTIDKYRKNLLEKTHTINTPQLLGYLTELNIL